MTHLRTSAVRLLLTQVVICLVTLIAPPMRTYATPLIKPSSSDVLDTGTEGAQTEGANQRRDESTPCIGEVAEMSCVPGGSFRRGSEMPRTCPQGEVRRLPPNAPNHRPAREITVDTFYMDRTEVTYKAYQECVRERQCARRKPAYSDYSRARQPMVGLSWYEAYRYCKARGKHLPTEAEWELAARGLSSERYPWGDAEPTCDHAVIKDKRGRSCGVKKRRGKGPKKGRTLVVGSRPAGRFGLFDMIGNAEEWTADWYSRDWERCGASCQGVNPKGPCPHQAPDQPCAGKRRKVVRGGSWYWGKECATSWTRRPHFPRNKPYHHFGFRCAASLSEARALRDGSSPDP